jgi:hypothetical protein
MTRNLLGKISSVNYVVIYVPTGDEEGREFGNRIEFVRLDWRLPEGIPEDKEVLKPVESFRWPGELYIYSTKTRHRQY